MEISKNDGIPNASVIYMDFTKSLKDRKNDKFNLISDKEKTALNEKLFNIYEPLSIIDWSKTMKVLLNTNSYAFIQFLPFNSKNFINFLNNTIHIVPRRFLLSAKNNQEIFYQEKDFFQLPFEKYWASPKREIIYNKQKNDKVSFYKYNFPFRHLFAKIDEKTNGKSLHSFYYDMICYFKEIESIGIFVYFK